MYCEGMPTDTRTATITTQEKEIAMDARPKSPWMSREDVAAYLAVTDQTVDRYSRDGKLPRYKLAGYTVRYRREDVEALITPYVADDEE